jgi:hypothetical protein
MPELLQNSWGVFPAFHGVLPHGSLGALPQSVLE